MKNIAKVIVLPIVCAIGVYIVAVIYYFVAMNALIWWADITGSPRPGRMLLPLTERIAIFAALFGIPIGAVLSGALFERPNKLLKKNGEPDKFALMVGIAVICGLCLFALLAFGPMAFQQLSSNAIVATMGFGAIASWLLRKLESWGALG